MVTGTKEWQKGATAAKLPLMLSGIRYKLFFAILVANILPLVTLYLSANWIYSSSFRDYLIKVEALTEIYHLPASDLIANLINTALQKVEAQMPYVAGTEGIRIEEGEPIYEDIEGTPAYLAAKARLGSGG